MPVLVLETVSAVATSAWDSSEVGDQESSAGEEEWGTGNVEGGVTGIGESRVNLCDILARQVPFPLVACDLPLPNVIDKKN